MSNPRNPYFINIIVIAIDEKAITEQCLETIWHADNTEGPYRIILVDNGSVNEGARRYYDSLAKANRVYLVRLRAGEGVNERTGKCRTFQSFSAAVNAGMRKVEELTPQGQPCGHILLLNNDTIVTRGWLHEMRLALENVPRAGIVGPYTNYCAGDQKIDSMPRLPRPGDSNDLDAKDILNEFAASLKQKQKYGAKKTKFLSGFCMLIREDLYTEIGGMDPRFEKSNYEDNDYCKRAELAGWDLVIAQHAFVFHYGHVTFSLLSKTYGNCDYSEVLQQSGEVYRRKWGDATLDGIKIDIPKEEFPSPQWDGSLLLCTSPQDIQPFVEPPKYISALPPAPGFIVDPNGATKLVKAKPEDPQVSGWSMRVSGQDEQRRFVDRPVEIKPFRLGRVHICMPNYRGAVLTPTGMCMTRLTNALTKAGRDYVISFHAGTSIYESRHNAAWDTIADPEATHLVFLDDDMVWEPSDFFRLEEDLAIEGCDIVGGLGFSNGKPSETKPCIFGQLQGVPEYGDKTWWAIMATYPKDQLFEVYGLGFGMTAIRREVLVNMAVGKPEDWCHFIYRENRSEDTSFCINARKAGFRVWCDSRSKLGHISREIVIITEQDYLDAGAAAHFAEHRNGVVGLHSPDSMYLNVVDLSKESNASLPGSTLAYPYPNFEREGAIA